MKIAIIGSGFTGLAAGYKLSKEGHEVTVFEKDPHTGGLASSFPVGNDNLDSFYHHIFITDSYLLDLARELNLEDKINWYEPKNAIFLDNRLYPFTTPMDLLLFKPIGLLSRIRMGLLVLGSKYIKDYKPFENITAKEWIIKRSGRDAYDKVWGPLLKSKFDLDSDMVSGTWIWNKFKLRGSSRGKSKVKELLGYMDGGFAVLADTLAEKIRNKNGAFYLNTAVKEIRKTTEGKWEVITDNESKLFDRILFAAAPELLAKICPELPQDYKKSLEAIKYKANLCLTLELTKSLSPYYWITISQKGLPFVLIIEHTNLVGLRNYGSRIVYLSRYIDASDPFYSASDEAIANSFLKGLKKVFPSFKEDMIIKATLNRARFAQPVSTLGYGERIPDIKTCESGLYLASMAQIYPEDRGLNYAIKLGYKAADIIIGG